MLNHSSPATQFPRLIPNVFFLPSRLKYKALQARKRFVTYESRCIKRYREELDDTTGPVPNICHKPTWCEASISGAPSGGSSKYFPTASGLRPAVASKKRRRNDPGPTCAE